VFIRKKKNVSGSISIHVIEKSSGRYVVLKTLGTSSDPAVWKRLILNAKQEIIKLTKQPVINFAQQKEEELLDLFINGIEDFRLVGPELVFGRIFDRIGFSCIQDPLLRYLVISRLVFPLSKLKTIDYLRRFNGTELEVDAVYLYLDKLHRDQMFLVQQIGYEHAVKVSGEGLTAVFYDVTTLYFEAEEEDELRIAGFSKDGKHSQPQIVLGLLVNASGFPLAYQIFEGNKLKAIP